MKKKFKFLVICWKLIKTLSKAPENIDSVHSSTEITFGACLKTVSKILAQLSFYLS